METLNQVMHWLNSFDHLLSVLTKVLHVVKVLLAIVAVPSNILFRAARKFSPGTGLAPGYYKNFLEPVMKADDGPSEILLWMSAAGDLSQNRSRFENKTELTDYDNVLVGKGPEGRTVRIAKLRDGRKIGLDFPRTLTGDDLFLLIKRPAARWLRWLGGEDAMQRRELRNFWETLSDCIRKGNYQTRIKAFCGDPASAQTDARDLKSWPAMLKRTIPKPNLLLRAIGF
ncbi:MAG TPA: hypothetical protein VNF45_02145 [Candidatus Binataceae bacterium]|nr:hypothetical protein [Candidatus Binataceae bacterium]